MARVRADVLLVARGLAPSRERARAAILAGEVRAAGRAVRKAGELLEDDASVSVAAGPRYVSRGGVKLEHALDAFGLDVSGARALDVGASTGGFTDCLLQHGAVSVTALDVGYGQLAWKLRNDARVSVLERTNVRATGPRWPGAPFDLAVVDVSFVGLAKVLPNVLAALTVEGEALALVKPQFEAGKARVGRRGVVRDPRVHAEVLHAVRETVAGLGWVVTSTTWSPVKGPEGNIEFWVRICRDGSPDQSRPEDVVEAAHRVLGE